MLQKEFEVQSSCGAATLWAAIFCEHPDKVKARLGLPTSKPICPSCGELTLNKRGKPAKNKEGLCTKCWRKSRYILVACSHCGALKKRLASQIVFRTSQGGYQHFFCDRYCLGKWAGEHYGFKVHNKLAERGPHKRKWDYDRVWQKHLDTCWGAYRLSRLLGIPRGTLYGILSQKRKAMKAVNDDL